MVLYKNEHAYGAGKLQKCTSPNIWNTWTSAECRDLCSRTKDCLAVDYVGQDEACFMHTRTFTRTKASTGYSQPDTVAQYAKDPAKNCGTIHERIILNEETLYGGCGKKCHNIGTIDNKFNCKKISDCRESSSGWVKGVYMCDYCTCDCEKEQVDGDIFTEERDEVFNEVDLYGTCMNTCPYTSGLVRTNFKGCDRVEDSTKERHGYLSGLVRCDFCKVRCINKVGAKACRTIDNCDTVTCNSPCTHPNENSTCKRCNGYHGLNKQKSCNTKDSQVHGCSAFRSNIKATACIEMCSWRPTSTPCWPGECGPEGYKTSCTCQSWFKGKDCLTITQPPEIKDAHIKLAICTGASARPQVQNNPNELDKPNKTFWTSSKDITHINIRSTAEWKPGLLSMPKYVSKTKTHVGIQKATVKLISRRANGNERIEHFPFCGGTSLADAPERTKPVLCEVKESHLNNATLNHIIEHRASLFVQIHFTAGGFVTVMNLDDDMKNAESIRNFQTAASVYQTTFKWDLEKPYSKSDDFLRLSIEKAKSNITAQNITASWLGWQDDDTDVHANVTVIVNLLEARGEVLHDHCGGERNTIPFANGSTVVPAVTTPGVYSVILTVSDNANPGNQEQARRFFTFDPDSKLEVNANTFAKFSSAASNTSLDDQWQHNTDMPVVYTFSRDRFINHNHTTGKYLGAISKCSLVKDKYDDNDGLRNTSAILNNEGVVKMEIGYIKHRYPKRPSTLNITLKPIDIFSTTATFNIPKMEDGDTIEVIHRVTDYMDRTFNESKKLRIDSSPAVIADIALTRDGIKSLVVHNSVQLRTMTFEWLAFDYDTGVKQIEWTIYDNHTDLMSVINHGHQKIGHQGNYEDLAACKERHSTAPYGADCYCTTYHGCFHRHFRMNPQVSDGNGLHPQRKEAPHDADIYINITVINSANLKSTLIKKITVDTSPPRSGIIHDGLPGAGNPELDYKNDRNLAAYWDGFFDHESGIIYYQYSWGTSCLRADRFGVIDGRSKVTNTTEATARWTAPAPGKYYITVVAFNGALDHSEPACSNGVTVDETGPVMGGLTIENTVTKPGLGKQGRKVYYVRTDRRKVEIRSPSQICIDKATETTDLTIYTDATFPNGTLRTTSTTFCESKKALSLAAFTPLTVESYFSANWTAHDRESGIESYEIGLMSNTGAMAAPDIMAYTRTDHGSLGHFKRYHPGLTAGRVFYVGLRSYNKASLKTEQIFGPFVVEVTPPTFTGKSGIETHAKDGELVATWPANGFVDGESADPFDYKFAVGTTSGGTDVVSWSPITPGADCQAASPPTPSCTHIPMKARRLHPGDTYYISIRATNYVGLFVVVTSVAVKHYADSPAKGYVRDVAPTDERPIVHFGEHNDIGYQTNKDSLEVAWDGFERPYHTTQYSVGVGTTPGGTDVVARKIVTGSSYKFEGLLLVAFKTYYTTVWAKNPNGEVNVTSDGVRILDAKATLNTKVYDGPRPSLNESGAADIDYQASASFISAHWSLPKNVTDYVSHVLWKVEEQDDVIDSTSWKIFQPFLELKLADHVDSLNAGLVCGKRYRSVLRACYDSVCFNDDLSDGFLVSCKVPAAGAMSIKLQEPKTIEVEFDRFRDQDIPDIYIDLSRSVVEDYLWALKTNAEPGQHIVSWTKANVNLTNEKGAFSVVLDKPLAFKECYRFLLRGISKSGLSTTISKEIKSCDAIKPFEPTVIDAVGLPMIDEATKTPVPGKGLPIFKKQNDAWLIPDRDYTPYINILSATWPSLRHRKYKYSVIEDETMDAIAHFKTGEIIFEDPCSLPTKIKCGFTENEYVNVEFETGTLLHGKRYYICIHADAVVKKHEKWTETLAEVNNCSDGITIDLTAPKPGEVWIGANKEEAFLTSRTEMYINWSGFVDVEELGKSPYASGIKQYEYGVGSLPGKDDVVKFTNIGMTNHHLLHGLNLEDGHAYYVTIRGTDHVNQTATATSAAATVDTTPPLKTNISMQHHHSTNGVVSASWEDIFYDKETVISYYECSVGSQPGYADIMPPTRTTQTFGTSISKLDMQEGHVYWLSVKAHNKAGLSSLATGWPFLCDYSPPVCGFVHDGIRGSATADRKARNYQEDDGHIWAHWEFSDPHSGIVSYSWSVGSCAGCGDVFKDHPVGTNTDAVADKFGVALRQGLTYYVTVTACNGVGLCSSASSDGVLIDSSPPISGLVHDGVGLFDIDYQNSRASVGAKWWGFIDPQSGISYYSWWVGTTPGGDDIMKEERLHHTEMAFRLSLPGGVMLTPDRVIYTTVKATNPLGLSNTATSDGFKVVTQVPKVTPPTHIGTKGSIYRNTQVFSTVMGFSWTVESTGAPIKSQHFHLWADVYHRKDMPTVKLGSTVSYYYATNVKLYDGTWYSASVTACNLAELCATSKSEKILVDNSPPLTGMFAIDTAHAPQLKREEQGHWNWTSNSLTLAVLGFTDLHSGIKYYDVSVGTTYGGNDLTKGKSVRFNHGPSPWLRQHEGSIQRMVLKDDKFANNLKAEMDVYISVVGINGVGLSSAVLQKKFRLLSGGGVALRRRCERELCEGHCICSPQNARCGRSMNNCPSKSPDGLKLAVYDIIDIRENVSPLDSDYSPSTCMLAAEWRVDPTSTVKPIGYDYAVGFTSEDEPTGLTSKDNIIWRYVGLSLRAIDTRAWHNNYLLETSKYSVFVRAWTNRTENKIFKSNGVWPVFRPPSLSKKMAATVKDCQIGDQKKGTAQAKDVDFYSSNDRFCVSWKNAFQDRSDNFFDKYYVSLGTYPSGEDVLGFQQQSASSSHAEFTRSKIIPGKRYYNNVRACNKAGLCSERYSDGVIADVHPPVGGIVSDGLGLHDEEYHNRTNLVAAHWKDFVDLGSGISHYWWCAGKTPAANDCDVMGWMNVGLKTRASRLVKSALTPGGKVYNKVYAVDGVGHRSGVVVSNGVMLDTTPPTILTKLRFGDNIVTNPSFEAGPGIKMAAATSLNKPINFTTPTGWMNKNRGKSAMITVDDAPLAKHGRHFLFLYGSLYQTLQELVIGEKYILVFYTSHIQPSHSPGPTKGQVSLPDGNVYVFSQTNRTHRHDVIGNTHQTSWNKQVFYFYAKSPSGDVVISSNDTKNGFAIDDVSVQKIQDGAAPSTDEYIKKDFKTPMLFTVEEDILTVAWDFEDKESPIVEYKLALGTRKGDARLYGYETVGQNKFAKIYVKLVHDTSVYVTVIARNAAGLRRILLSDAIKADKTPPVFEYLWDGDEDGDAFFQDSSTVKAQWSVSDPESGIQYCQYAIGSTPGALDITPFTSVENDDRKISHALNQSSMPGRIYTTVRCHNFAGGTTTMTTNGVGFVQSKPSSTNAWVRISTGSETVYPNHWSAVKTFQSQTEEMFLHWDGFSDPNGIRSYEVNIRNVGKTGPIWDKWIDVPSTMTYMRAYNLGLKNGGTYKVAVRAVNVVDKRSEEVGTKVMVTSDPPKVNNGKVPELLWSDRGKSFTMDWRSVFPQEAVFSFVVCFGTVRGGADIKKWQETTSTNMTFRLEPDLQTISTFYTAITAVNSAGLYTVFVHTIQKSEIKQKP
ncbi:uncharacterized protein LOC135497317 isoform X2 [Lineus longissimus]